MCVFLLAAGLSVLGVPVGEAATMLSGSEKAAKLAPIVLYVPFPHSPRHMQFETDTVPEQVHLSLHDRILIRRGTRCLHVLC